MEELNIPYEIKTFKRKADMTAPNELKKIQPLGKSPVITITTPNCPEPLVLAESAVIIEYLCTHFGGEKLIPQRYAAGKQGQVGGETEAWMRYQYFMHYTEGSLMPFLVMKVVMNSISILHRSLIVDNELMILRCEECAGPVLHQASD